MSKGPRFPTMLHALQEAASRRDDAGVDLLGERRGEPSAHRSFAELYEGARRAAGALAARGVEPGENVVVILPTSFEFITTFFGLQLLGAVPVPAYPPAVTERRERAAARLGHVLASSGARTCVTDARLRPLLAPHVERALDAAELDGPPAPERDADPRAPAFIQYTSGSTRRPRGVLLSHDSVVANADAIGLAIGASDVDRVVSWLPLYHDMGLIGGLLTSVYWRMQLALMSPLAFMVDPLRWLETLDAHRGTVSPAPNFAYALCVKRAARDPERARKIDLSTWRVALNGAEPVSRRVIEDFQATFGPCGLRASAMLPVYGLAEGCLAATFPDPGAEPEWEVVDRAQLMEGRAVPREDGPGAISVVSVGAALPGHECFVVDDDDEEVSEGRVGHVVVRGPSLMEGYFGDPEATDEVLVDGTLWTGDLGFVSRGRLFVTGRSKDLVIVRGRNYHPEDLERIAATVEGVRAGSVVAFAVEGEETERAVLLCETREEDAEVRSALARRVVEVTSEATGLGLDDVVLLAPGSLPKTSSGKLQRGRARRLYVEGALGA
jgi:acyl-CoA synthetase (AMP-forming)/AMP-acid ligase II